MNTILAFFISTILFVGHLVLLIVENKKNRRVLLVRVRAWIDSGLFLVLTIVGRFFSYVEKFFFQLGIRTVLHVFLRRILLSIAAVYDMLINYFEYNRKQRKLLKKTKASWKNNNSFLSQLQTEKEHTALSDEERKDRKQKAIDTGYYN